MGYMRHHAIIVTAADYSKPSLREVRDKAEELAKHSFCVVSEVTGKAMNGYQSFLVAPDGSKEGWTDSDKGDEVRDAIIAYLNSLRDSEGGTSFKFVEVRFGDDEKRNKLCRTSEDMPEWVRDAG